MFKSLSGQKDLIATENFDIGRDPTSGILDRKCARVQVQVAYDKESQTAKVTQKGTQNSSVNGTVIGKGKTVTLKVGHKLKVLSGKFIYEFCEAETKSTDDTQSSPSKRKRMAADGNSGPPDKKGSAANSGEWKSTEDLHICKPSDIEDRSKIAGFDIDGTIITTKSGRVFATDENDWQLLYPEVPKKIKELYEDDYKIVFFTNQKGLSTGKVTLAAFKRKVKAICDKLTVPIHVFISPGTLKYRKPYVGMWEELEKNGNGGVEIDRKKSIYVGDAAGRPALGSRKKDFSASDRLFALNLEVKFQTPEEFFLGKKSEKFNLPEFDPKSVIDTNIPLVEPSDATITSDSTEMIVMVGTPASGKSSFVKAKIEPKGYVVANRDTLKTWQKCVKVAEESVKAGKSVVIDNTNPDIATRKLYLDVAKSAKVPCRCFVMNVTHGQALHNNKFRQLIGADKEHKGVNDMVMNMYKSKYKQPTVDEGFSEIVKVNCIPVLKTTEQKRVYKMYLVEK